MRTPNATEGSTPPLEQVRQALDPAREWDELPGGGFAGPWGSCRGCPGPLSVTPGRYGVKAECARGCTGRDAIGPDLAHLLDGDGDDAASDSADAHAEAASPPAEALPSEGPPATRQQRRRMMFAALDYVGRGFAVLPLVPGGKDPLGEVVPHGFKDASTDPDVIRGWWARYPDANLGVVVPEGFIVLDVDTPDGAGSRASLEAEFGPLPTTVCAITGNLGDHLWFRDDGRELSNRIGFRLGIDAKAGGRGYVVAPPSVLENGGEYSWKIGPEAAEIAGLPAAWLDALWPLPAGPQSRPTSSPAPPDETADEKWAAEALERECNAIVGAAEGERNHQFNRSCFNIGQIVGGGALDRGTAEAHLRPAAERAGLTATEIRKTLRSGLNAGIAKPRTRPAKDTPRASVPVGDNGTGHAAAGDGGGESEQSAEDQELSPDELKDQPIRLGPDEHRVADETMKRLALDENLFYRGPSLVRVIRRRDKTDGVVRPEGAATIAEVPPANLRERITKLAKFEKWDGRRKKGEELVDASPPGYLAPAVAARGEWPELRPLSSVSDAPVLRPDGSIWQTPGYDAATGVLYEPAPGLDFRPVPEDATIDDAQAAADELVEVVEDFPFEGEAHRAGWLAALLTLLGRFAFHGPAPAFVVDSNVRGAGKGLCAQTIGRIGLGHDMPVASYAHDAEEMRKVITSIAIAGDRVVLLDNVEGKFGNAALDAALTSTRWKDRILGKSEQVELPLVPVWLATGNNVTVGADTARRIIHVRLDVLNEQPEARTGFKHPDLLAWVSRERGRLLSAGLTILSAYLKRGVPAPDLAPFGSFEGWSGLVRQAVVWTGQPDPCETRARLADQADSTAEQLRQLAGAWRAYCWQGEGTTLADLIAGLYPSQPSTAPSFPEALAMRAAIEQAVELPAGKTPTARRLGYTMRKFRRRVVNGVFFDSERSRAAAVWRLYRASDMSPARAGEGDGDVC